MKMVSELGLEETEATMDRNGEKHFRAKLWRQENLEDKWPVAFASTGRWARSKINQGVSVFINKQEGTGNIIGEG